jgi:hypothetical protein
VTQGKTTPLRQKADWIHKSWDKSIPGGHCNILASLWFGVVTSTANLVTDVAIIFIPQKAIWGLMMSPKKKLGVSIVFAIGVIGLVAATIRMYYIVRNSVDPDFTVSCFQSFLYSKNQVLTSLVFSIPSPLSFLHAWPRALASPWSCVHPPFRVLSPVYLTYSRL